MKYAVIETGSKQYIVQKGTVLSVEKLTAQPGETITFDKIPLFVDDKDIQLGKPYCDITVEATVVDQERGRKLVGMHYETGSYRRKFGHKQHLTKVEILDFKETKSKSAKAQKEA